MKMKKILITIMLLFASQIIFSTSTGLLFNVSVSRGTLIFTPKANHTYPDVGLLITSPNYHFSTPNTQCTNWPNTQGYCKFSAGPSLPASISINGPAGLVNFKLCLNFWGKLSCQNYTVNLQQDLCDTVGGKKILGSNICWVKERIPVSTVILRCSTVCTNAGLVLQQPGPINSAILAGNVCSAFGYTNTPIQNSPGNITFTGQADSQGATSCFWQNLTGTDWDNPANTDYQGATGNYICPCI